MKTVNIPHSTNIVTLQTFDKDGNLTKEWSGENAYTCVGINLRLFGKASTTISGTSVQNDKNYVGLIEFANSLSSVRPNWSFRTFCINDDATPLSYDLPPNNDSIVGTKQFLTIGSSSFATNPSFSYGGKTYVANTFTADYGYGNVNMTIRKVYQVPSSAGTSVPCNYIIIPSGFTVNVDERLVITYRHLFDILTYYDDNGTTFNLKETYKNVLMDSGTFEYNSEMHSYEVVANHLYNTAIAKSSTNDSLNWAIGSYPSSGTNSHRIHYGTGQTILINDTVTTMSYSSDSTKTLITRTVNIKFPPTVPELLQINKIDIDLTKGSGQFGNLSYPMSIVFPVPWDKGPDTEFEFTVQWTEDVGQLTS